MATTGPPAALVRVLVEGPSVLSGLEWHERLTTTTGPAVAAARRGLPEVHAVLADFQTAGRGRRDRSWQAPPGTSVLLSLMLRPPGTAQRLPLLPLLTGLALAEAVEPFCRGATATLKWPNDLLVGGRKAAGVLAQVEPPDAAVVGVGVNVDWRGLARPARLTQATSLAEAAGGPVDRWKVLAGFVGVFGHRYQEWRDQPEAFLADYRARCATLGQRVRVTRPGVPQLQGQATAIGDDGTLQVTVEGGRTQSVSAGDVTHVHPGPRA